GKTLTKKIHEMRAYFTHYRIWFLLSVLWIIVFHEQLSYPIILEEIDYLRFLMTDSITDPKIWNLEFFYHTDGHPPLLSLLISAIAFSVKSTFFVRCF